MEELIMALLAEAEQLESWADGQEKYGWSTDLCKPMRERAIKLRSIARKYAGMKSCWLSDLNKER